ncbi:MAG: DNA translocase FtsK [Bacteroidales bacterium]|nr:DNA translocase FtsK [Bacteroidales bacterium]
MATSKKKTTNKKGKTAARKKYSGGFVAFLKSKRFAHIRGALYILFSAFLVIAMVGYYATGGGATGRWLGTVGQGIAEFFAINLFGIGSLGFVLLFFVYGMRLLGSPVMPWWKTFGATLFWMLWCSLTLGYIGGAWVKDADFERFAGIGLQMAAPLHQWLRWWTLVLLVFVAVLFMVMVHKMQLPEVHLPNVDVKKVAKEVSKAAKEVEKEIVNVTTDHTDDTPILPIQEPVDTPEDDDPGADFDDEAMKLFNSKPAEVAPEEPQMEIKSDLPEEVTFDIDKAFEEVNARAQGNTNGDGITFTINDTDDNPIENTEDSETSANPDFTETPEEELDPDDYRQHYGLDEPYDPHLDLKDYIMPTTDILEDWETANVKVTKEELIANKDRIVQTLKDYGIEITDITATPGPTVTLYKIKPAPGVRISKIKNLEDDIALSLAALGIRIIAPIPGESNVGIEVPNAKPQIVAMKTMLESDAFKNNKMELPVAFGKTISNECFVTDLAKMPHLLMAGATGTGKSVGLNAVLASLLYTKHPSELKLVLVDPKKVEFSLYSALDHHYLAKMPDEEEAVITDVKKVVRTLNSLCIEMDTRYDLLKQAKVRKITEYNEKFCKRMLNPEHGHRYLPYIVVVIDEFGDLIMTAGKEVELPIARLAQLARAVGIHLIIATQRPTTNIITGTIKANFPARVAFRVTSGIDSKTILDTGGAQQLIGRGDMLISLAGKDMIRLQCALIDTPEIERLVKYIGDQRGYADGFTLPEYLDENEEPNKEFDAKSKDEYFNDAARLVVASQFGSTSLLQRKLQLGYNRAGRIIDQLEAAGIVGPSNGSKPRDVLIHDEVTLEELLKSL